jgi:hypothetical protein
MACIDGSGQHNPLRRGILPYHVLAKQLDKVNLPSHNSIAERRQPLITAPDATVGASVGASVVAAAVLPTAVQRVGSRRE